MKTETNTKLDKQQLLEAGKRVRPNCAIPDSFFQDNMVVCTGEDPEELKRAMQAVLPGKRPRFHQYRCYKAWKFSDPNITVVISGIGSGCLEPLLYELLDQDALGSRVPQRLVMIGTAGYIAKDGHGQVFLVDEAYPMGCAVNVGQSDLPKVPRFKDSKLLASLPRAAEMSTDYYYAATPATDNARKMAAKQADPALAASIERYWREGRLISMESAQFYHFCGCYGSSETQYLALRGVANLADQFHEQGEHSQNVLTDALRIAVKLLGE